MLPVTIIGARSHGAAIIAPPNLPYKGGHSISWFSKADRDVDYTPLFNKIIKTQEKILATINDQNAIVTKLMTDGQLFLKDATAKLVALAANQTDPAVAQGINDTVTSLTALDNAFTTAEAALNPPATGPSLTP